MKLYLLEDEAARSFQPFALTRPVGELLYGCGLLRTRIEAFFGMKAEGYLGASELTGFEEPGAPPILETARYPCVVALSRWAPEGDPPSLASAGRLTLDGSSVAWIAFAPSDLPDDLNPATDTGAATIEVAGSLLDAPWHLMATNPDRVRLDIGSGASSVPVEGAHTLGEHGLVFADDVWIAPGVVLDARHGPIRLDGGVRVEPGSILAGPLYVGEGSSILGGSVGSSSIGPHCKIRGEVSTSVVTGFSNKAHDGYLGHAVLGRWVNLGALTTNSDLKNNYSEVRVDIGAGPVDTGETKVGVFLGDHAKTGIGTMLTTGCVIGAGANVFGGEMPPRYVPPFSWGRGHDLEAYDLDRFLDTARIVMKRRGQVLTDSMAGLLERAWNGAHGGGA